MDYRKNVLVRNKLVNNFVRKGEKSVSEKVLSKSVKELLKNSNKQFTEIVRLFLVSLTGPFKLSTVSQKKRKKIKTTRPTEIPAFVSIKISRVSLAVKRLITVVRAKKGQKLHHKLKKEIFLSAQCKGESINLRNNLQRRVSINKHFFSYFKWR